VPLGLFYYWGWLLWAIVLLLFGRHPRIYDPYPLGWGRRSIGLLALLIFIGSFSVIPVDAP
jgi:hypothetical protein